MDRHLWSLNQQPFDYNPGVVTTTAQVNCKWSIEHWFFILTSHRNPYYAVLSESFGSKSPKSFLNSGFIFSHIKQCLSRLLCWAADNGAPWAGGIACASLLPFTALNISFNSLCPEYWTEWATSKLLSLSADSLWGAIRKKSLSLLKKRGLERELEAKWMSLRWAVLKACPHSAVTLMANTYSTDSLPWRCSPLKHWEVNQNKHKPTE